MGRKTAVYEAYTEILIWFKIIKQNGCLEKLNSWLLKKKNPVTKLENLNYSVWALVWDNCPCNKAIFPLQHYSHKTKWGSVAQQNQILENIICDAV